MGAVIRVMILPAVGFCRLLTFSRKVYTVLGGSL